jgi:hypothetical protein
LKWFQNGINTGPLVMPDLWKWGREVTTWIVTSAMGSGV